MTTFPDTDHRAANNAHEDLRIQFGIVPLELHHTTSQEIFDIGKNVVKELSRSEQKVSSDKHDIKRRIFMSHGQKPETKRDELEVDENFWDKYHRIKRREHHDHWSEYSERFSPLNKVTNLRLTDGAHSEKRERIGRLRKEASGDITVTAQDEQLSLVSHTNKVLDEDSLMKQEKSTTDTIPHFYHWTADKELYRAPGLYQNPSEYRTDPSLNHSRHLR